MQQDINILVIEDELSIRTGLTDVLVFHGYTVDCAEDGPSGLKKSLSGLYDLILLDIMLPGIDGFEICDKVRKKYPEQAIIMLTAKSDDEDIIQGLTLGADDYVSKPFSIAQLILRIKAVLRRTAIESEKINVIQLNESKSIDILNYQMELDGKTIHFTKKEIAVLLYLYQNQNRPVPRSELLNKVWGYSNELELETRTVDIHIAKIRRKIEQNPSHPEHLNTVRGAGYKLHCMGLSD